MIHFSRLQILAVLGGCLLAFLIALPNAIPSATLAKLPSWFPSRQVSLGLDLQGGSHLLFQIDLDSVIRERMATSGDSVRSELAKANVPVSDFGEEGATIHFKLTNPADESKARSAIGTADSELQVSTDADGSVTLTKPASAIATIRAAAIQQTIEIIRRRVDETGTKEPTIEQEGSDRILVQLPGVGDPERVKELIGTTAKLTFRLVDTEATQADFARNHAPPGSDLLPLDKSNPPQLIAVRKRVMVSGENLVDAQPGFNQQNGGAVINFTFDSVGAKRFGDATTANVGKPFAIVLDKKVLSAPVIRDAITGGRGEISGSFTTQTASDLALLLRAGALPAPLTVIEQRSVGPDLGADSIRAGGIASALGFVLVAIFMIVIYGKFGVMADVALAINLVFIIACMTLLQATLTLPGIAGIVLTMGMSVDANVLIFERIREEQKHGRSVIPSIDIGYRRAFVTIIDSNLTTLIATICLYIFGTGPVRGFAVTLVIGIVGSIFTAVMLTRLMMVVWLRRTRPQTVLV
jgi:preprotein translocase subunit SecD